MAEATATKSSKEKDVEHIERRPREVARQAVSSGQYSDILALQRTIGNQAVSQLLQPRATPSITLPPGLGVSQIGDRHEGEADRVAKQFTDGPSDQQSVSGTEDTLKPLSKSDSSVNSFGGTSHSLPQTLRASFERRFGHDFSDVRIHEGASAAESARSLNATAYTLGQDIVFGPRQYAPQTPSGRRLLAHELTHVVQQTRRGAASGKGLLSQVSPAAGVIQRKEVEKEDWDFSRADYEGLIKKKGALKVGSDSSWFPAKLQENLLSTLNYLFDPLRTPAGTEGVNVKDLYHGHVGLKKTEAKGGLPKDLAEKKTKLEAKQTELYEKALGKTYNDVTKENIKEFTKAEEAVLPVAGNLLSEALKQSKGLVVVYHTFEMSSPSDLKGKAGLKVGDPRRNYITPVDTNKPGPYSPPDIDNASSWLNDYFEVLQFSFLVDNKGEVHIRTGSTKQLSSVTGTPLS